jgi:hypothetical protein
MRSESEHDMPPRARDEGVARPSALCMGDPSAAVRVQHRLAEILMLLDELQAELADEAAPQLRWIAEEVDVMCESVENVLDRLAN